MRLFQIQNTLKLVQKLRIDLKKIYPAKLTAKVLQIKLHYKEKNLTHILSCWRMITLFLQLYLKHWGISNETRSK